MKPTNIILTAPMLALLATLAPLATVAPLATPHAADTSSLVADDYYVAADGNDSNPGTILQPLATIEKASLAVQSRIATGMTKDITVVLRHQTKTLETFVCSLDTFVCSRWGWWGSLGFGTSFSGPRSSPTT